MVRADPASVRGRLSRLDAAVRDRAAGRLWWARAPILAWLIWILVHYWRDPGYHTLFQGIDLVFHEIGHILWAPLGEFAGMAGGTLTQLLAPVAAGAVLHRQRDWFGVAFAVAWLGINCFEVASYAGDAIARRLPLVSPTTAEPLHDWAYLLTELNVIEHTAAVAAAWWWAGALLMGAGVAFGGRVLWHMATATSRPRPDPRAVGAAASDDEGARLAEYLDRLNRG